jgi:hypothetical protein
MLAGLLETVEQVQLNVNIIRSLGELHFAPCLSCRPSPCLLVAQHLLIDIQNGQMRRYPFKTVWFVNIRIYTLERLE